MYKGKGPTKSRTLRGPRAQKNVCAHVHYCMKKKNNKKYKKRVKFSIMILVTYFNIIKKRKKEEN